VFEVTVRIDEFVPPGVMVRLDGVVEALRLVEFTDVDRLIVPPKPPELLMVMDEVPDEPAMMVRLEGFAVIVKSPTPTETCDK
jgi:hypothetical protein